MKQATSHNWRNRYLNDQTQKTRTVSWSMRKFMYNKGFKCWIFNTFSQHHLILWSIPIAMVFFSQLHNPNAKLGKLINTLLLVIKTLFKLIIVHKFKIFQSCIGYAFTNSQQILLFVSFKVQITFMMTE